MDYLTSSEFYPDYSNDDKVKLYSVFGGIPYFNSLIDTSMSVEENIIELVTRKDSILEHEINEVILNETSKINEMNLIISLIAEGVTKYSDMAARLAKDKIRADYYLEKLIDMEIIEKKTPINDKNNKKRTFYVFRDNLMNFYYNYVFENYSMRSYMAKEDFYRLRIKDDFETSYIPKKFESIAREFLILANKHGLIEPIFFDIGTFSYDDSKNKRNVRLDIVTKDEYGYISYECKYTNAKIGISVIAEEEEQTIGLGMNIYKLGFISKNGFTEDVKFPEHNCFTLDDIYKL